MLFRSILGMDVDKVATCSDSSLWGGGVSYSIGLSEIGRRRLWEAEAQAVGPRSDDLVVLELFGGIGAGRRACQLLGVQPGSHLSSEIDKGAIRIMQSSFPACVEIGDIEEVTPEKLIHAVSNNPHVKQVLIIGGSPCQDLSGVNIHGQGLEGRNSRLFFAAVKIIFHAAPAAWPEAKVDFMIENVASMKPCDRDRMSQALGVLPIKCCPSSVWPVKRPRYYWLSWGMETTGEYQMMEEEGFTKCTIQGNAKSLASYLPHYQTIPRDMKALPTFMRSISRKTPRNAPAGIDNCGPQDLARWRDDQHRFPPYQYKHDNTIYDKRKRKRSVPDTRLREVLMLFREDHTYAGITGRERCKGPEQHRDLRDSWLGNSMHCGVVAVLLRPFFHSTYPNCSLPSVQELIDMNPRKNVRNMSEEMRLTRAYCTYQSHRGGEIRNEQGPEPSLQRCGFQAIQGDQWKWKAAISCQWHLTTEHINALECRALLLALK